MSALANAWQHWWQARAPGEQRALRLLLAVLAAVLVWQLLWRPLQQYRTQAMQRSASELALHAHLRQHAPAMAARVAAARLLKAEDVPAVLAGHARGYPLAVESLDARGNGQWQLQAQSGDPAALLAFVHGLSQIGLTAVSVQIARQPAGHWQAQLDLAH